MTGIPDELVEKAMAVYRTSGSMTMTGSVMRAALEAVGLPALLERVEAAEGEVAMALRMHDLQYARANRIEAERDALAALSEECGQ